MAIENETADQVVRMVLQGSEVVLRLSGEAAINVAKLVYGALKGDLTTKGKATLWEFLKSGKKQKVFEIPDEYLKAFTTASKKFGFPFVVLKDKDKTSKMTDIMVYASDASKVNRVIEELKLNLKQVETSMEPEVKTEKPVLVKPFEDQLRVPFTLIDGIPDYPTGNIKTDKEINKLIPKLKRSGTHIAGYIGIVVKPDGRYEPANEEVAIRLLAVKRAGFERVASDILVPAKTEVDVQAENVDERPEQDRNETEKDKEALAEVEAAKDEPAKEEGQNVNPTMARMTDEKASGQESEPPKKKSRTENGGKSATMARKRKSVKAELEDCKAISAEREAKKAAERTAAVVAGPVAKKVNTRG